MRQFMILILCGMSFVATAGDEYKIDAGHSSIIFSTSHQTVGVATGRFNSFEGSAVFDGDTLNSVELSIDVDSIDTNHAKRDGHLKNEDFFSAKQFPKATFKSTSIKKDGDGYKITGDLTMVGKTKPVTLSAKTLGPVDGRGGVKLRGIHATGSFMRSEWDINYGIPSIGDEINLQINFELAHK